MSNYPMTDGDNAIEFFCSAEELDQIARAAWIQGVSVEEMQRRLLSDGIRTEAAYRRLVLDVALRQVQ
jgi:predicted HTH domain antitoxin